MTSDVHTDIAALIAQLEDPQIINRIHASNALAKIGRPAVPALVAALASRSGQVRWGAARALRTIADPDSVPALVQLLEDPRHDVRWLAAQGLIALGPMAMRPLLQALSQSSWDDLPLRQGAHHVLHELVGDDSETVISPVIAALEGSEAGMTVPVAAFKALNVLDGIA